MGIPASIQNLLNVTGSTILNNFTAGFGPAAVAAMGVAQKLNMVPLQIGMGFSQGVMPLVSYNFASGDRKRMKKSILFAMSVILPVMASITLCYWVFGPGLVRSFMDNLEIVTYGASFLRGMSLSMVFMCVDFMAVGVFQALGMGKNALVFAILRKIVLEIPLLIILNAIFPLYGLPYAQPVAEFILSIAAVVMLMRIFRQGDALQKQRL